ncbi:MAG TPA: hypothetical protein VN682_06090 [Terriglobales bacterium]|nr:hypothetical protein [Terriglobales bacterium]
MSMVALIVFFLLAGTRYSAGQNAPASENDPKKAEIDKLLKIYKANPANPTSFVSDPTQYDRYLVVSTVPAKLVAKEEQQRIDKQTATSAGSGASTSAVSKASVPWLFGFAAEHGAVTQSVDNNVTTFRGNIANLAKAINAKDYIES